MNLVKLSLSEQVYKILREDIITQKIPMGERLNIRELEKRYGVSSSPLREALSRLNQDGLIQYTSNIGARVVEIEKKDAVEIINLASLLDCGAVKFTFLEGKQEDLSKDLCIPIEKYEKTDDEKEKAESAKAFHDGLYKYANNSRLLVMREHIANQLAILRNVYYHRMLSEIEEHKEICSAIAANDCNKATTLIKEHYDNILKKLELSDENK